MKPALMKRIEEAEAKAATVQDAGLVRFISGGCYTREELDLIRATEEPKDPCLKPKVICIVGVETEQRPARPLAELLEQYNREV